MLFDMISFLLAFVLLIHCHCAEICTKLDQYCFCDDRCGRYGDCCPGHANFRKPPITDITMSCRSISETKKAWVVDKCGDPDHKLAKLCSKYETLPDNRLKSLIPVVDMDGQLYDNSFCALCNDETKFDYLKIRVICAGFNPQTYQEVRDLVNNGSFCYVVPFYPENVVRYCAKNLIRTCPPEYATKNNKTVLELCESKVMGEISLVTNGGNIYRNDYCCSCWNETCFQFQSFDSPLTFGFSYLLNFNEWDSDLASPGNSTAHSTIDNTTSSNVAENTIYFMSFAFTVVSMMALALLIGIYASQRIFHTFGGYLTICLSTCLFLMNFMILLVTSSAITTSGVCRTLGVIQHFVALSNFIWMAIYALDLMQTFGFRSGSRSKKKSVKTFFVYCGAGFGLAAMVVGSAVIIDLSVDGNSTIRPKYGGPKCWFTSKIGGIIWYFVPVCILLAWNVTACVVVFYKLSMTAKECRVVQQKDSNNTIWLCLRLTAVFGIGYIFQIIAVLSGVQELVVIGSLINCLQGCLLAACFMWTKRVLNVVTSTVASITGSRAATDTSQSQTTKVTGISRTKDDIETNKT